MLQLSVLSAEVSVCGLTEMLAPCYRGSFSLPLPRAASFYQSASLERCLLSLKPAQDSGLDFPSAIADEKLHVFFLKIFSFILNILY